MFFQFTDESRNFVLNVRKLKSEVDEFCLEIEENKDGIFCSTETWLILIKKFVIPPVIYFEKIVLSVKKRAERDISCSDRFYKSPCVGTSVYSKSFEGSEVGFSTDGTFLYLLKAYRPRSSTSERQFCSDFKKFLSDSKLLSKNCSLLVKFNFPK